MDSLLGRKKEEVTTEKLNSSGHFALKYYLKLLVEDYLRKDQLSRLCLRAVHPLI